MSKTRRPPEILRKSHPHLEADERARSRRELLDALDEAIESDDPDAQADSDDGYSRDAGNPDDVDEHSPRG